MARSRQAAIGALALALACPALLLGCGGGGGSSGSQSSPPAQTTTLSPEQQAESAARRFLDRYVTSDGRVQRLDQGGDTVGEGQAYGMLLAAGIGDGPRFDAIWTWTKRNIRRPDGLLSFLWRDGRVQDPQAAADADVDASRALLVASCRLHRPALRAEGVALGRAIMANETGTVQGTPVLVAGPWARKDPETLNPSYFSPATFAALDSATGDGRWGSLSASARTLTGALMSGPNRLPPDWAQLQGGKPVPTGPPGQPGSPPEFSFDAARTLVRMAEDPDPAGDRIAARAWPVFAGQDPASLTVEHDLSGRSVGGTHHPVVLVAAAGAAQAAGHPDDARRLLAAAEALDQQSPTYYGGAWVGIGRMMLTTKDLAVTC